MGLKAASRISEEQNLRLKIAEKRRASLEMARERFSGSLHVEDLEGDIRRTWEAMRMRANPEDRACTLSAISEELADRSMESGTIREEANAEAQVAAMVATLFLVNRGYASIEQKDAIDGSVILTDLHPDESNFEELSLRLHPPPEIEGGCLMNQPELSTILEAILFGAGRSMTVGEIAFAAQEDEGLVEGSAFGISGQHYRADDQEPYRYLRYREGG